MSQPPRLTDRTALERQRRRSARAPGADEALFLHAEAIASVQDRLSMVNRTFRDVAIVTGQPGPWQRAFPEARIVPDTEVLDLAEGAQDCVIHALALHWAEDPVGQLVQARRALRPDGLFLGVLFGGQSLHELRTALAEAESRLTGGLSPRIAPMAEIRDLGGLLQRAGFALPVTDSETLTVRYPDPLRLMRELRAMGEGNALAARLRRPTRRAVLLEAARLYAAHFGDANGIPATAEMIYLTGWAPDASQPQPLRPGSATQSLAAALGTRENPLRD